MIQAFLGAQNINDFPWLEILDDLCRYNDFLKKFAQLDNLGALLYRVLNTVDLAENEALLQFLETITREERVIPQLVNQQTIRLLIGHLAASAPRGEVAGTGVIVNSFGKRDGS